MSDKKKWMENSVALFLPKVSPCGERKRERDSWFEWKSSLETEVVSFEETRIRSPVSREIREFSKISNDPYVR